MVELIRELGQITRAKPLPALSADTPYVLDLRETALFHDMVPAQAVVITSPKTDTGGAALYVRVNGSNTRTFWVAGGGATHTEPGPVYSLEITADAAVAASARDVVTVTAVAE